MKIKSTKKAFETKLLSQFNNLSKRIYKEEGIGGCQFNPTYTTCHLYYDGDKHVATWVKGSGVIFEDQKAA